MTPEIAAFAERFPYLFDPQRPLVEISKVRRCSVESPTPELLQFVPFFDSMGIGWELHDEDCAVYLLGPHGFLLGEVSQRTRLFNPTTESDSIGEPIGQAIERIGALRVHAVLKVHIGVAIRRYDCTLYLPPDGFTVAEWCARLDGARAALESRVSQTCRMFGRRSSVLPDGQVWHVPTPAAAIEAWAIWRRMCRLQPNNGVTLRIEDDNTLTIQPTFCGLYENFKIFIYPDGTVEDGPSEQSAPQLPPELPEDRV